jgi:hypothetical protein
MSFGELYIYFKVYKLMPVNGSFLFIAKYGCGYALNPNSYNWNPLMNYKG